MISQETNHNYKVTIKIIKDNEVWVLDVHSNQVISDLINMAISHFLDPKESHNLSLKHKFISVSQKKILNLQSSIRDENIQNNEELLLVPLISANFTTQKKLSLDEIKGPSQEEISNATANLISQNPVQVIPSLHCQENLQSEISKVLYSLVEASAKILALRPDAKIIFDVIITRINAQLKKVLDENAVKYLEDLGFTTYQAKYALHLKRNRQIEAMEWLLENHNFLKEEIAEPSKQSPATSDINHSDDPLVMIQKLLKDILKSHHLYFEPSFRAMMSLMEMGFDAGDVFEALRVTNNNQLAACDWLCGERGSEVTNQSVSLDTDSQLYKALMNNPAIQLGLYNPKILLAFLSVLENPANANMWLNDVDTAPVLGQIFKIYHSEKHIMIVNEQLQLMQRRNTQT